MREVRILNLGAGVQSTTCLLLAHDVSLWGVNLLDFAIFADTGEEPKAVYEHLAWLQRISSVPIMIRTRGKLGEDLKRGKNSTGQRFASIPAFTTETEGQPGGMTRRQCSKEYKIEVIERAIRRDILNLKPRQRIPKDVHVTQYYGISADEAGRARRIEIRAREHKWLTVKFPLLKLGWTRNDCLKFLADKVPHEVPKSACVFCPYHSDAEWLKIKSVPEDWARAVEIDEALRGDNIYARKYRQKMYVHRSSLPLVQIAFNPKPTSREQQTNLRFTEECMGVCGV